jgi:hypothetical protein
VIDRSTSRIPEAALTHQIDYDNDNDNDDTDPGSAFDDDNHLSPNAGEPRETLLLM